MRFALPNRRRPSGPLLLELDLSRGVVETPSATPLRLVGARPAPTLHALLTALRQAELDRHVAGLVAHIAQRSISLALSSELRDAVGRFRRSGKVAVAWTESFGELGVGNVGYHLATAFEEIWLQPSGDVGLTGVVARAAFVRDALDRLGVCPREVVDALQRRKASKRAVWTEAIVEVERRS